MNTIGKSLATLCNTYSCRSWQKHILLVFRGRHRELAHTSLESHGLLVTGSQGTQTLQHTDIQTSTTHCSVMH